MNLLLFMFQVAALIATGPSHYRRLRQRARDIAANEKMDAILVAHKQTLRGYE